MTGPIALLAAADVTPQFATPAFESLAAQELGSLPNLEDSIEADAVEAMGWVNDAAVLIASMHGYTDQLWAVLVETQQDDTEIIIENLAGGGDFADSLFGNIQNSLSVFTQ